MKKRDSFTPLSWNLKSLIRGASSALAGTLMSMVSQLR